MRFLSGGGVPSSDRPQSGVHPRSHLRPIPTYHDRFPLTNGPFPLTADSHSWHTPTYQRPIHAYSRSPLTNGRFPLSLGRFPLTAASHLEPFPIYLEPIPTHLRPVPTSTNQTKTRALRRAGGRFCVLAPWGTRSTHAWLVQDGLCALLDAGGRVGGGRTAPRRTGGGGCRVLGVLMTG